uniref:Uncharacterized protein n=1 Tax=Euplotes crassus TaxID=5936 RepID=A0A7S3KBZ3_EUPCR
MRLELLVFGFGVTCALCLPYYMKAISRKRQENRRLDLEEAYANSFGKNQSDFAKMGGVVKIDKSGNRSIINQSQDDGMDDFMREVQAANDLAREDSMSSNQSDHFGGLGSQNIQTRRFGQKSSGFTGRYNE